MVKNLKTIANILYISPRDMRKNRADPVHIMYSCNAFSKLGIKVTLVTPTVERQDYYTKRSEIFELYGLKDNFDIVELPTNLSEVDGRSSSFIKVVFNKFYHHLKYLVKNRKAFIDKKTLIYSKCFISTVPYICFRKLKLINSKIVFELPYFKKNIYHKFILTHCNYIVAWSSMLISRLINEFKFPKNRIINIGVSLIIEDRHMQQNISKSECRKHFNFTKNDIYITYTGKVATYTGKVGESMIAANQFIKLSQELPKYKFIIIGRYNESINYYNRLNIKNLITLPFLPFPEFNKLIVASDILLALYTVEDDKYNKYYLLPAKAGQFLYSGNPVIFSNLPSLRELFSGEIVNFCNTKDIPNIINTINQIINNPDKSQIMAKRAKDFSLKHTFNHTANRIINFLESQ